MNASEQIDKQIANVEPWKAKLMLEFRQILKEVNSDLVEGWKWNTGVWSYNDNLICAFSGFKDHVKFNFFNGAFLSDPHKLFNNGLDSKKQRSIDIFEGDSLQVDNLKELIREAIELAATK